MQPRHGSHPAFSDIGTILWLFGQAELQGGFALTDALRLVLPPVALGQYRIWRRGARPVGAVLWAELSPGMACKMKAGDHTLADEDWRCGDQVFVTDFCAPFGDVRAMARDFRRNAINGRGFTATRRGPDGNYRRPMHFAPQSPPRTSGVEFRGMAVL